MSPLVSIVIPCYKGAEYLPQAIQSCLDQTEPNLEIIVVDDASPDLSADIAGQFAARDSRVSLARHTRNGGVSRAFNTGFRQARGTYLTRLAQDDWFAPNAIATMARFLEENPTIGLTYADENQVEEDGALRHRVRRPAAAMEALRGGNHLGLCVMWRHTVWSQVGEFNPDFDTAEDYDYWERVVRRYPIAHCPSPEPLLFIRNHAEMGTKRFAGKQEFLAAQILARYAGGDSAGRRALAQAYLNAAYNFSRGGDSRQSSHCLGQVLTYWPECGRLLRPIAATFLRNILARAGLGGRRA